MVQNPFFQFPLCALSFGATERERLNAILTYSFVEAGSKMLGRLSEHEWQAFLGGQRATGAIPKGFDPNSREHRAAVYGAKALGIRFGDLKSGIERFMFLRNFISDFSKRHGRDALVRIKKDWLFDTRDGHGLTYREFSVLCAIYSAIGDKDLAIVTRERIRRCALGYRTAAIMDVELRERADKARPLTQRQVRDTIARLHRNRFFARCTVGRRVTYYSIRLSGEALRKKILERRTYAEFFHASQAAQDQALNAALQRKRREIAQTQPKAPSLTPRFTVTVPGDS